VSFARKETMSQGMTRLVYFKGFWSAYWRIMKWKFVPVRQMLIPQLQGLVIVNPALKVSVAHKRAAEYDDQRHDPVVTDIARQG
jgi:hypothetical protein